MRTRATSSPFGRVSARSTRPSELGLRGDLAHRARERVERASSSAQPIDHRRARARSPRRGRARSRRGSRRAARRSRRRSRRAPRVRCSRRRLRDDPRRRARRLARRRAIELGLARSSPSSSQDHEIVAVDGLVDALVAEPGLDGGRLQALDLAQVVGGVGDQAARDLVARRASRRDRVAELELAVDRDDAGRQQALAAVAQRARGAVVDDERAGGLARRTRSSACARDSTSRAGGTNSVPTSAPASTRDEHVGLAAGRDDRRHAGARDDRAPSRPCSPCRPSRRRSSSRPRPARPRDRCRARSASARRSRRARPRRR